MTLLINEIIYLSEIYLKDCLLATEKNTGCLKKKPHAITLLLITQMKKIIFYLFNYNS
jgi:hypothetical protein